MKDYEPILRLGFFLGVLVLMALWEVLAPRRRLTAKKPLRWLSNLGLVLLNSVLVRLGFALGAVGVALAVQEQKWGLLNNLALPLWLEVVLAFLALDLAIYLQHVLFHAVPVLWRLHMVHHVDPDFDVTTGVRFHTIEIALSMGLKVAAIVVIGPPPVAVLLFEIALNATSLFNHGNVWMPTWLDGVLRWIVVTPEMHRVHHSTVPHETNSNFGFNLPWWDRLLGTYRGQPAAGHEQMEIGVSDVDRQQAVRLWWMLLLPFRGKSNQYPIGRER